MTPTDGYVPTWRRPIHDATAANVNPSLTGSHTRTSTMENVKITTSADGKKVTIEIDATAPGYVSESGKSLVLATTRGFAPVEGTPYSLSLNFTKRIPKAPK